MNRLEFDKLNIDSQVEYINTKLQAGNTLTNICKDISIGRSTIRDRFKKYSYEYDKVSNEYKSIIEVVEDNQINEILSKDEQKQESSNLVVGTDNKLLDEILINYNDMNNKLNEVYNWYLNSSNKVVENKKLEIQDFEGDLVTRSFKLYESVQQDFLSFCKKNSKYKVQDILSQAIKEFIDRYN